MWPGYKLAGCDIRCGISGNGYYVGGDDPWQFARRQSFWRVYRVEFSTETVVKNPTRQVAEDFSGQNGVPKDLARLLTRELANWALEEVFHPTVGRLLTYGEAKAVSSEQLVPVLGFAKATQVHLCSLLGSRSSIELAGQLGVVDVKQILHELVIDVNQLVKQVEFPDHQDPLIVRSQYVGCRSDHEVFIFKVIPDVRRNLTVELVGTVQGDMFVDLQFNCWNLMQFATVEASGKWVVWQVYERQVSPIFQVALGTVESLELSLWKAVAWRSTEELLVYDRKKSYCVKISNGTDRSEKIEKHSSLLQVRRCPGAVGEVFYLTSHSIIWENLATGRILTYKHYLNNEDFSLRFTLAETVSGDARVYTVMVHSLLHAVYFVFRFEACQGRYYAIGQPTMMPLDELAQSGVLIKGEWLGSETSAEFYGFYQLTKDSAIQRTILSTDGIARMYNKSKELERLSPEEREFQESQLSRLLKKISKAKAKELFRPVATEGAVEEAVSADGQAVVEYVTKLLKVDDLGQLETEFLKDLIRIANKGKTVPEISVTGGEQIKELLSHWDEINDADVTINDIQLENDFAARVPEFFSQVADPPVTEFRSQPLVQSQVEKGHFGKRRKKNKKRRGF